MNLIKRIFLKRRDEAELNTESCNAAGYYIKKQPDAPLDEKTRMLNYVAHGFYMGYRKLEEELGVKNANSKG